MNASQTKHDGAAIFSSSRYWWCGADFHITRNDTGSTAVKISTYSVVFAFIFVREVVQSVQRVREGGKSRMKRRAILLRCHPLPPTRKKCAR